MILFQLLDAVVPKHILSLVGLLVLFLFGFAVETLPCRLFTGFTAPFAAQIAAGIWGREHPPALAAGTHDHAGIQHPLAVIDQSRPQRTAHYRTFKGDFSMGIPQLQLGVFPMIPYGNNRLFPFPIAISGEYSPKGRISS